MAQRGWEVEANPDGTFDVRLDGRSVAYDVDDYEIPGVMRRWKAGRGTEYTLIEQDGYRSRQRVR